jgi:antitoxin CptB
MFADPRRRRLLFRAQRRGTREADLLIGGFVSRHIAGLTDADLDLLERLLDLPGSELLDWCFGRRPVPAHHATPLLEHLMRDCCASGAGAPQETRRT